MIPNRVYIRIEEGYYGCFSENGPLTRYTMHGRGAKTLNLGSCRITTVSGIPVLSSFLSCDARNVKYLFFKRPQKGGPQLILDQMNLQGPVQL